MTSWVPCSSPRREGYDRLHFADAEVRARKWPSRCQWSSTDQASPTDPWPLLKRLLGTASRARSREPVTLSKAETCQGLQARLLVNVHKREENFRDCRGQRRPQTESFVQYPEGFCHVHVTLFLTLMAFSLIDPMFLLEYLFFLMFFCLFSVFVFNIYLFVWLHRTLVAACRIFVATCGIF